jgi:SAM-dependent methyltransferase
VTGLDFSKAAIEAAMDLARQTQLDGKSNFIEGDVLEWYQNAKPDFDIVITTYGVLCWLSDLNPWARGIAASLKPGGLFFLAEGHPIADSFITWEEGLTGKRLENYFGSIEDDEAKPAPDYASTHVVNQGNTQWSRPISNIIQSLIDVGLHLESFEEHPYSHYEKVKGLKKRPDGYWHRPTEGSQIPLLFNLKMSKPII